MTRRVATLMVHTSPLEQPGTGDAGGMNTYVVESAIKMATQGVEVDIFTRAAQENLAPVVDLAPGVKVRHIDAGPYKGLTKEELPSQLGALTHGAMSIINKLPKNYYEVLHSHYWISGQLGWMISEQKKIPLVHTMHTMAKVKNLSLAEGDRPEPTTRAIGEEQIVKNAAALIANTDSETASLVSLYNACPDKVFVVTPGVALDVFTPGAGKSAARTKLNIAQDVHVLLFVGRIQPHKGPEVLVRTLAEMISHTPHLRSKLALIIMGGASGSGSNEPERLRALAQFLGVEELVHFKSPVARHELPEWYRAADLVCVPSYSESFGLVALEAQACGTPVVATAVGGLRTAVADGISGSLVDGHDPRAWSAVISRLLADPSRRAALSLGALAHAANFGWKFTASKTIEVYDWVLSGREKSSIKLLS